MSTIPRLYEPLKECRKWPQNPVNEWSVSSCKESLIPAVTQKSVNWSRLRPGQEPDHVTISNVETNVVTFSIVQRERDALQCYVYWQGQAHRICPGDVLETKTVLRDIFLKTDYLESDRANLQLMELEKMIRDTEFTYFRNISQRKSKE